jgi:hypothetical protein
MVFRGVTLANLPPGTSTQMPSAALTALGWHAYFLRYVIWSADAIFLRYHSSAGHNSRSMAAKANGLGKPAWISGIHAGNNSVLLVVQTPCMPCWQACCLRCYQQTLSTFVTGGNGAFRASAAYCGNQSQRCRQRQTLDGSDSFAVVPTDRMQECQCFDPTHRGALGARTKLLTVQNSTLLLPPDEVRTGTVGCARNMQSMSCKAMCHCITDSWQYRTPPSCSHLMR